MAPLEDRALAQEVSIREFRPRDEISFRRLNEEWITRYFGIEARDKETLGNPQVSILARGGRIIFATVGDECVGCCALLRLKEDEFEIGKMAVTPACQGKGIGRKLLQAAIEIARAAGARRLYLETNHKLTPAMRVYEAAGFKPVPPERVVPSPYARADVYLEMMLD
jgi:putative acetyltransferase